MIITEDNYLGMVIANLETLKYAFEDDVIPKQVFDGNCEDAIEELGALIEYLNKIHEPEQEKGMYQEPPNVLHD